MLNSMMLGKAKTVSGFAYNDGSVELAVENEHGERVSFTVDPDTLAACYQAYFAAIGDREKESAQMGVAVCDVRVAA